MQLWINNWGSALLQPLTAAATTAEVDPSAAARLTGLGSGDHYLLTLIGGDGVGNENAWEIVRVTAAAGGSLTIERAQEGTAARDWPTAAAIEMRITAGAMAEIAAAAAAAVQSGDLAAVATSGAYSDLSGAPTIPSTAEEVGAATAAQGAKADTAVQPGDLSAVATSGAYADLSGKPEIPSTAGDVGAIPAAEKGAALGVATLDAGSKIPLAQLPAAAITDTFVVNTEVAMLALAAEVGDVAIRPDIASSFILQAEPASVLGNWQQIITPSIGGGAPVGSATPQALGGASPGVSGNASREDHVHPMPSAEDVGADAAGASAAAQAHAIQRANHTGEQAISTVTGLQAALDALPPMTVALSDETTALTAGTGLLTFRAPAARTLTGIRASLTTAQASGAIMTVDMNVNGVSVLSTKMTIDNTEKTSTTAAAQPVISSADIADDAEISFDIDQIGDGTARGLKITLYWSAA